MTQEQFIERLKTAGFTFGKWDGYWHREENPGISITIWFAPNGNCEVAIYHSISDETAIDVHTIYEAAKMFEELYIFDTEY